MNTIAFLAFLMGINSAPAPVRPNRADGPQKPDTVQRTPEKPYRAPKRGGWDRN